MATRYSLVLSIVQNYHETQNYPDFNQEMIRNLSIKTQVKESSSENTAVSYGIYSTQYQEDYVYTMGHSSTIQTGENNDLGQQIKLHYNTSR